MIKYLTFLIIFTALSTSSFATPKIVKIGATLPLTGRLAVAGQDARQGIELALRDFSSSSIKLEAVFDDNQHDAKLAAISAKKLLEIDQVNVLISMWDMADVVAPLSEKKKVPHLTVRWDPHLTEKYKYTFTFESTYKSYVESLFALLKKSNVTSISLITEEAQGWILSSNYLKEISSQSGIEIVGEERFTASNDYRPTILRATRNKPEMIILFSNPPHTELLIKQIKESAANQKFTGYFEIIDPKLVNQIPFVAQFEVQDWFVRKFIKHYGTSPQSRAAQVYDMVHMISLASIDKAEGPLTPEELISALSKIPKGIGATGKLKTNFPRVVESICVWKISTDGQYVLMEK